MIWRRKKFPAAGLLSSGIVLRELDFAATAPAAGCRILFFSDTHFRSNTVRNTCSVSPLKEWCGTDQIGETLIRSVNEIAPDVLIFGGDLVGHTVHYPAAFEILSKMNAPVKLAVYGNWERKTRSWLPSAPVEAGFRKAGFQLLFNRSVMFRGIQFSGVEDFRFDSPTIPEIEPDAKFRCLISHNPDVRNSYPVMIWRCAVIRMAGRSGYRSSVRSGLHRYIGNGLNTDFAHIRKNLLLQLLPGSVLRLS